MSMTIEEMERRAIDDGLYMDAMKETTVQDTPNGIIVHTPPPVVFFPRCGLSHGLASVLRQSEENDGGIFWALVAIASWVTCGGTDRSPNDGFDDDGFDHNTYARLLDTWPDLRSFMQFFQLRRYGPDGAELLVHGGSSAKEDDSRNTYAIQRWHHAEFPWNANGRPFRVYAVRQPGDSRPPWVLILPREY
jgi:hypothetical protein